jgi:hypothetical protein
LEEGFAVAGADVDRSLAAATVDTRSDTQADAAPGIRGLASI